MAKRSTSKKKLSFVDIVMNAEAEDIKRAYEARVEVDKLLAEREEAYRRIAQLEEQVEDIIGEKGVFVFDPPPCPVAGLETASPKRKRSKTSSSKSSSGSSAKSSSSSSSTSGGSAAAAKDQNQKQDSAAKTDHAGPPKSKADGTTDGNTSADKDSTSKNSS